MSLVHLTATEQLAQLQTGAVSAVELTSAYLSQIDKYDEQVGAYLSVCRDGALRRAAEVDERRRRGVHLGPLAGLPVAVKDVLCTKNLPTTCGSRMLERFCPPYDATAVAKLQAADAVLLGKTNMDEFAMGGSTENSALAVTRNPWDLTRTPGGSSGGAAAAVAALMTPLSVGSDTGGSIRQPASYCGVVGLKPTYGRVSRYGLVAFASSLDQVGPLARTVEDVALLLEVLAGHDRCDATSVDVPVPRYSQTLQRPLEGLRLGIVREQFEQKLDPKVETLMHEALSVYEASGATIKELSMPHSKYGVAAYCIIAASEASSNLARYDGVHYGYRTDMTAIREEIAQQRSQFQSVADETALQSLDSPMVTMYRRTRAEGFGPEVKRRIMLGTYALSAGYYDAYYLKALKVRRLIHNDFDQAFSQVDLILGPVTASAAFLLGEKVNDPLAMYVVDFFTVSANLAGIAGLSLPCGFSRDGLPIGLQLQAPPFEEERLLRGAFMYQQENETRRKTPELVRKSI